MRGPVIRRLGLFVLALALAGSSDGRIIDRLPEDAFDPDKMPIARAQDGYPNYTFRIHKNGRFWNVINNNGIFGNFFGSPDVEIGRGGANYFHPGYSRFRHGFYTGLWVGGVRGEDTTVSIAIDVDHRGWWSDFNSEFWPDFYPFGDFVKIEPSTNAAANDALSSSQVAYQCTYTDTFKYEDFVPYSTYDGRYHQPLDIKVTQTSYSWAYGYAEDFIVIDYKIQNIGTLDITDAYVGFYYVGGVHFQNELPYVFLDDLEGRIDSVPYEVEEIGHEKLDLVWVVDRNGDPNGNFWHPLSTRNAFGLAPLYYPPSCTTINFNWWAPIDNDADWGPRKTGTTAEPLRYFFGKIGEPLGDANKYYMMSKPEVDYCGYRAAVDMTSKGWLPPSIEAEDISNGHYTHWVYSVGPFDLPVAKSENVTMVFSIGENAHTRGGAYRDLFDPYNPDAFIDYLDFSDLINNVRWAKRIYDNPGVDTDLDGDSGKSYIYFDSLQQDTIQIFYEGDGVPDFRGATPPPAPDIRVTTDQGKITVRWNGRDVESFFDTFSQLRDFEGYRVYLARSRHEDDIVMITSYDVENYSRWEYNTRRGGFELKTTPFTLDSLRTLYGESFEPLEYTRARPFSDDQGRLYFFTSVEYNLSELVREPGRIYKVYPDAILDTTDVDEEGRMRYYEYECVIDNLLPTVPYFVSVTAFDFGYPAKSLTSLESAPGQNLYEVFAIPQWENVDDHPGEDLGAYVYPNPYRVDDGYVERGLENRFTDLYSERARTLYFANVPHRCTISIFTIDGDLIKVIEHDEPIGGGTSSVARWDLISRNDQGITSGMYYWVIESERGSQIGKLVIIK